MAISVNSGAARVREIDESTGALLRFDGGRVAAFVTSFNAADAGFYQIVGTKGQISVDPGYEYAASLEYEWTAGGRTTRKRIGKRDQFAPELLYFSDCIRNNRQPEPSGEEGLQDVRIVEALYRSAETGKAVSIPPYRPAQQPTGRQRIRRPGIAKPALVKVKSSNEG
jgi:glucose-fructose oxidoreductase